MLIPSQFSLGGFVWKVVRRKRLPGCYGNCNLKKRIINLLDTLDQPMKEQTFLHELTHAIKYSMGEVDHDEKHTDAFAVLLHQYMVTAQE